MQFLSNVYYSYLRSPTTDDIFSNKNELLPTDQNLLLTTEKCMKLFGTSMATIGCLAGGVVALATLPTTNHISHPPYTWDNDVKNAFPLLGVVSMLFCTSFAIQMRIDITAEEQYIRGLFDQALQQLELAKSIMRSGFKRRVDIVNLCSAAQIQLDQEKTLYVSRVNKIVGFRSSYRCNAEATRRFNAEAKLAKETIREFLNNLRNTIELIRQSESP